MPMVVSPHEGTFSHDSRGPSWNFSHRGDLPTPLRPFTCFRGFYAGPSDNRFEALSHFSIDRPRQIASFTPHSPSYSFSPLKLAHPIIYKVTLSTTKAPRLIANRAAVPHGRLMLCGLELFCAIDRMLLSSVLEVRFVKQRSFFVASPRSSAPCFFFKLDRPSVDIHTRQWDLPSAFLVPPKDERSQVLCNHVPIPGF